ncbi:hypothetical protein SAMN02744102_03147 [Paenibacillus barengoltzii]|nr:hypothetical protein SAMN02744102_03147 [Paenibacillus barengoltzii]
MYSPGSTGEPPVFDRTNAARANGRADRSFLPFGPHVCRLGRGRPKLAVAFYGRQRIKLVNRLNSGRGYLAVLLPRTVYFTPAAISFIRS